MIYKLLSPLAKFLKPKKIRIYNNVFNLHGKLSVGLFLLFSIVISVKEYFGEPINCMAKEKKYAEYYCWIHGTYILRKYLNGSHGNHAVTIGVGEDYWNSQHDRIYQRYYQWIGIIFVTLAFLFYIPALVWKLWEDGRIRSLCGDFCSPQISSNWNGLEAVRIVKYLRQKNHIIIHRMYAYRFLFCEILNFGIVLATIFGVEMIFDNFWMEYSKAVGALLSLNSSVWLQQSSTFFPKVAKCTFNNMGPSGTVENKDALCLLPLNIVNEKIFAFLWLWIMFLVIISGMNLIYKFILIINHRIRIKILQSQTFEGKFKEISLITYNGDYGQWFFLYQLSQNINPVIFNEIIVELIKYDRDLRYIKESGDEEHI